MAESAATAVGGRHRLGWMIGAAILITGIYLPTLAARFDFIDDGSLVYPQGDDSPAAVARRAWETTLSDFRQRGPFRPVLWAHLAAEAEWFHARPLAWRAAHLAWTFLAALSFLWLLSELGIHPAAAALTAALAVWNPYRGEAWINLTVTEGVAAPYALAALACAVRAARSPRPAKWDLAGFVCMLAALGCKNTFAAVVPAQLVLRCAAGDGSLRECPLRHGRRVAFLALTLLLPVAHFAAFKLSWHEGRYQTSGATWAQLWRMVTTVRGAASLEYLAAGLVLGVLALVESPAERRGKEATTPNEPFRPVAARLRRHRAAALAGLALLACGIGIYLPIDGVAGRYSIPAVWGADFLVAILLSEVVEVASSRWRTAALAAVCVGLGAVAIASVGKQEKFRARAALLWQTLERVERELPTGACLEWQCGAELNPSEAIHFQHHLSARGRGDVTLLVRNGTEALRLGSGDELPSYAVGERAAAGETAGWQLVRQFRIPYWGRWRAYCCCLFQIPDAAPR